MRKLLSILVLLFLLMSCAKRQESEKLIKIDGSSTLFPVTEAVAEEFQKQKQGKIRVTVGISGTGGGFKKFIRGEIDIANASRPILKEEMEQARANGIEYIELPVAFDALTVVVNKENNWVDYLTVEELKKVWEPEAQEKITKWSQIRPGFPDEKIVLFGAGADSGTFDYFTDAIVGKPKASRGDYTASEDDNVLVQGIEGNKYSLGYIPFAYYAPHSDRMKAVPIKWDKNKVKEPVVPSLENVLAGIYNPLSRPLFIYVSKKSLEEKPEVREFVEFYLKMAATLAKEVKYLPLPEKAYEMGLQRVARMQTGTGFGGIPEVGLGIEEILNRPPKS
ncbi:MAG: PstS family phosphate ABC transporter substrate-binding protein [Pyrinomonadaceae bacterium]|nr:PstS family phosphate ABC transporter substrate-binding protein [Pyrinomonadaceae bacterium]MCX7639956.1 PstS family phosphate ABC transporter substrate-binding protein [Pyrinomonadaceae bacterium]MDW8304128.1 PstS family phosphate ABC transporter substrate-binding protein [Acidobacteriota bacterium]